MNLRELNDFRRRYGIYLVFILMIIFMSIASPAFRTPRNMLNLLRQVSIIGLLSLGVTLVIISRGIDLSSGSLVALTAVVTATLVQEAGAHDKFFPNIGELPIIFPIAAGVGIGTLAGAINGSLIAYAKIPPFISTLGMMVMARGAAQLYTNGRPVAASREAFTILGKGSLLKIPIPVVIFIIMTIITWVILNHTRFGKNIYAIGGNVNAARVSGINVEKNLIKIYGYAGFLGGIAGVLLTARVGSGQPSFGQMYELDAIAATTIGGTSHGGGIGTVGGAFVGILILGIINNGFNLLGVSPYWQQIIKGLIIVVAVVIDMRKYARKE